MEYNSHRALTNTAWNILSYGWPIIFSILITPVVVNGLGIKDYGIYIFFNSIISILGLLDLGVSTAISKYLAEYHAQKNTDKVRALLGTSIGIFSIMAIVGICIFLAGAIFMNLVDTWGDYSHFTIGVIFAGISFVFSIITSIYSITFTALQRFDISSKIGIVVLTLQQLAILTVVLLGYSINEIFIVSAVITLLSFFTQKLLAKKILPELSQRLSWNMEEAKKYYKFGVVTFINNIATSSLTYLDRIIIPFFLGPSSLTYYSLPGNIANRIPSASNSLSAILFPMTSGLHGIGDIEKIRTLYIRSFRLITVVAAAITVSALAYSYETLKYWISTDFADKATTVLVILAFTNFILAIVSPLSNFLLGLGKLRFVTTFSITMAVLNLVLLTILLPIAGINGAAWAYLFSLAPVIYMIYFTEKHYLSLSERRAYYKKIVFGNIIVGGLTYLIAKFALAGLINSLLMVIIVGLLTVVLYIVLYWLFRLFEKEDIVSIKLFFNRTLKRI